MKLSLIVVFAFVFAFSGKSQSFFITDAETYNQSNPLDCNSIPPDQTNFFDQGGDYDPNMDEYAVFCPDLAQGTKVGIAFGTNIGYEWDVDPSDSLFIYDGPSTAANLLGAFNSVTDPVGFYVQATFENNPSGCLTARFVSDGANQGTGWVAKVGCGNAPQPFEPHLEAFVHGSTTNALNPIDTGYVNVCRGDSVLLVAKPVFPYSLENTGAGYSQTVDNMVYTWNVAGYGYLASTNDSVWFNPPAHIGYYIDCKIVDAQSQPHHIFCKIRVSQQPSFDGTGPEKDSVCFNIPVELAGGVTPTDTVGIEIPPAVFPSLGSFAGLTQLPDGSGTNYTAPVTLDDLEPGGVVTDGTDISMICIDIEHSFLEDLEIGLKCPNGTIVSLANTYPSAGLFPGGCDPGGLFLGNDTGIDQGTPGSPPVQYCFSPISNTLGTICAEYSTHTVNNVYGIPMLSADGVYLPDGNFDDFIGCPLNGAWSIVVRDNQSVDDGYIFEWSIVFDTDLYPNLETYQNVVVSENWTADPTIISGQSDTAIVVLPTAIGPHSYTYNVVDDFGCHYDTTVVLYVMDHPTIFPDTAVCDYQFHSQGNTAFLGGVWTCADTNVHFVPNANTLNPIFTSTIPGTFMVTFTDNACNDVLSRNITFKPYPYTEVNDNVNCVGEVVNLLASADPANSSYVWNNGATGNSIDVTQAGLYWVTAFNDCGQWTDSATVQTFICDIDAPNILALSSTQGNNEWYINYNGIIDYEISIVNRWQNVVFESDTPADKWNGRDKNGNIVSEGTYFYSIKATLFSGKVLEKEGFIQVYH